MRVNGNVCEKSLGDLDLLRAHAAASPAFCLDCYRCVSNPLDAAITAHFVAHHDGPPEFHCRDRDRNDPASRASCRQDRACKIHLAKQPAAEYVAMRIGVRGHGNCPQGGFGLRWSFGLS